MGATRGRSASWQFPEELSLLHDTGWRGSVFVVDDNFVGNVKEVRELLPRVAAWQRERGYPFRLFTEATLALAEDAERMDRTVAAGFHMVFVGIETPDLESLASVGKRQDLRSDMLQSVRTIQRKGKEVSAGFVLGFGTAPPSTYSTAGSGSSRTPASRRPW